MPSTFHWAEDNGAQTASASGSLRGATRTFGVAQVNWKNTDDVNTVYSSSPISAGSNSFPKYQFGIFSGTFNQISNCLFQHTTGDFTQPGFTLAFTGTSGYLTPAVTTLAGTTVNLTSTGLLSTGIPLLLGTTGPEHARATTLPNTGYTSYLTTQLQTTAAAGPGDTPTITLSLRFDEN